MVKYHIDLFIERETKLLQEIKDYFENLIQGNTNILVLEN